MATHPSILAWRIPWKEEPGRLQSIGSQRVRHDWSDLAHSDYSKPCGKQFISLRLKPIQPFKTPYDCEFPQGADLTSYSWSVNWVSRLFWAQRWAGSTEGVIVGTPGRERVQYPREEGKGWQRWQLSDPPTTQAGEILSGDQTMAGEAPSMEGDKTGLPDTKTLLFKPPPATHELCCYMCFSFFIWLVKHPSEL